MNILYALCDIAMRNDPLSQTNGILQTQAEPISILSIVLLSILSIIILLIAVCIIRALAFKPKGLPEQNTPLVQVNQDEVVSSFCQLLEIPTLTQLDEENADYSAHEKFISHLQQKYPKVFEKFTFERVGKIGLLFKLAGKTSDKPTVLMSHYDVVTFLEERWDTPPFTPTIKDGKIFARGAVDNKATLLCIMHSLEEILTKDPNFTPQNDLYLTFGGDEENSGASQQEIVALLKSRGIYASLVLDEGGAIVQNVFPGVKKQVAVVGLCEKGIANIELYVQSSGGHASTPSKDNPINILSRALVKLEQNPMKFEIVSPVAGMLDTLGRHSSFGMKIVFANMWLFKNLVIKIFAKGMETRAMLTSTFAYTKISGSPSPNVLPSEARININIRIASNHSLQQVVNHINKVINDDRVKLDVVIASEPSPVADMKGYAFNLVRDVMTNVYPEVIYSPYVMLAASDSRYYGDISDGTLKFAPFELSKEQRGAIHGDNENINIESLVKGVQFYTNLIQRI